MKFCNLENEKHDDDININVLKAQLKYFRAERGRNQSRPSWQIHARPLEEDNRYWTPFPYTFGLSRMGIACKFPLYHFQPSRILCRDIDYVVDTLSRVSYEYHVMHTRTGMGRNERRREAILSPIEQ